MGRLWMTLWIALLAAACGTQGTEGSGGGGHDLPHRGILPQADVALGDAGVSRVIESPEASPWTGITGLSTETGVTLYLSHASGIARAESEDGQIFAEPTDALIGDADMPSVVATEAGFAMFYATDGGLACASSADGLTFTRQGPLRLTPEGAEEAGGLSHPSVTYAEGETRVYYTARAEEEGTPSIWLARGEGAPCEAELTRAGRVLQAPGTPEMPCDRMTDPGGCFDAGGVLAAEVRRATTGGRRTVWRMMYTGLSASGAEAIGFAASFDGEVFERYPFNPILTESRGPTQVLKGDRYLLYTRRGRRGNVALSISERGKAVEVF